MSYIDAIWDRDNDRVRVVERDPKKGRIFIDYPAKYQFYYPDNKGKYRSIYGDSLSKVTCKTFKDFVKDKKSTQVTNYSKAISTPVSVY